MTRTTDVTRKIRIALILLAMFSITTAFACRPPWQPTPYTQGDDDDNNTGDDDDDNSTPDPNKTPNPAYPKEIDSSSLWTLYQVGDSSYAFRSKSYNNMGANGGFVVTDDGVIITEGHISDAAVASVVDEIESMTNKPILYAVNTHWHNDHAAGNDAFPAGAQIIAHEKSAEVIQGRAQRNPDIETTGNSGENDMELWGGRIVVLSMGKGHTEGDVMVYDPVDRVIWGGDMYVRRYVGYMSEGWFKEWIDGMDHALDREIWVAVPGHGSITDKAGLQEHRDYIFDFATSVKAYFDANGTYTGYTLPAQYQDYGSQSYLEDNVYRAWQLYQAGEMDSF